VAEGRGELKMKKVFLLISVLALSFSGIEDITFDLGSYARGNSGVVNSESWYAGLTNPALLGVKGSQPGISIENSEWILGTLIQHISYKSDWDKCSYALGISRLIDEDGVSRTDVSGNPLGIIKYEEYSIYGAIGCELSPGISLGTSLKSNNLNAVSNKQNYSMDLGIYYESNSFWNFGMKYQNLFVSSEKNDKKGYYLIGVNIYNEQLFCDIEYNNNIDKLSVGLGYGNKQFTISAGVDGDSNYSAGLKVYLFGLNIAYAYKNIEYHGAINRFGLVLDF